MKTLKLVNPRSLLGLWKEKNLKKRFKKVQIDETGGNPIKDT